MSISRGAGRHTHGKGRETKVENKAKQNVLLLLQGNDFGGSFDFVANPPHRPDSEAKLGAFR